jgi:hypothetical protein
MSDDPRGYGVKLQTKEGSVPSCNQPDCRTVTGSGDSLRKQGNEVGVIGGGDPDRGEKSYNTGSNVIDAGKGTTNPPFSKSSGVQVMPQKFSAGSGAAMPSARNLDRASDN